GQHMTAAIADQHVVAAAPNQRFAAVVADQDVVAARAGQRRGGRRTVDDRRSGGVAAHRASIGHIIIERTAERSIIGEKGIAERNWMSELLTMKCQATDPVPPLSLTGSSENVPT